VSVDKVTVDARGGKLIANDVLVLVKKLGTIHAFALTAAEVVFDPKQSFSPL
jgi:hypothetical protein